MLRADLTWPGAARRMTPGDSGAVVDWGGRRMGRGDSDDAAYAGERYTGGYETGYTGEYGTGYSEEYSAEYSARDRALIARDESDYLPAVIEDESGPVVIPG